MEIKILGTGCSSCKALYKTVLQVVNELDIATDVIKEEDLIKIMAYNIMQLPALVVNGKVMATGQQSLQQVKQILQSLKENN